METNYAQLEVLLMTGTTLTSGNLCNKNDYCSDAHLTEEERLEEACWNGFLQHMLPEIIFQPANSDNLYLWQIRQVGCLLELDLGNVPVTTERQYSISPHSFLSIQSFN